MKTREKRLFRRKLRIGIKFTMIELLAVVSVIAVLVTLLLPALNSAKAKAFAIHCSSNLKQVIQGQSMYAGDYAGFMVKQSQSGASNASPWTTLLLRTKYVTFASLTCPNVPRKVDDAFRKADNASAQFLYSYGFPTAADLYWDSITRPYGHFITYDSLNVHYDMKKMKSPSRIYLGSDTLVWNDVPESKRGYGIYHWARTGKPDGGRIHLRHSAGSNAGAADGHVSSRSIAQWRTASAITPNYFYALDGSTVDF